MNKTLLCFGIFLAPGLSWAVGAGGFSNQVVGARAKGMANAFSAVADDPSTVFFNPAGLVDLDGNEFTVGMASVFPASSYDNGDDITRLDDDTSLVPNLYLTRHRPTSRWAIGFGMFTPYGLKTVWPQDGPFNSVATESALAIPQFSPAVGFKANRHLSFGVGLVYTRVDTKLKSALPVDLVNVPLGGTPTGVPDGEQVMEGDGDGFGVNTGILFRPSDAHSFALTYRSDVKIDLKGTVTWQGLSNESAVVLGGTEYASSVESSITLPPSVTLGYAYRRNKWTLAGDAEWVGYSAYRATDLRFPSTSAFENRSTRHEYKDKWSVCGGVNYAWNARWETRAGYSFFPAVVPEGTWDPSVPDSDTRGLHAGTSLKIRAVGIDLSYSFFQYDPVVIRNTVGNDSLTTVNGTYKTSAQILSVNASMKF